MFVEDAAAMSTAATRRSTKATKTPKLTAPFPYFGGKSRVASIVWERLGNPSHYLEPFAGSLAVLLARPGEGLVEIVGDADGFIANFWRALQAEPEKVWDKTYYPCIEVDLHARAKWLREREPELVEKLRADIEFYDVKVAGWWLWGIALWIGGGWPRSEGKQRPHCIDNQGITGRTLADLQTLSLRLRKTRIICGDWTRTLGMIENRYRNNSAIFLDPPYTHQGRDTGCYHHDTSTLAAKVATWAIERPDMRIAYCGYECDEYTFPSDWECVPWKTGGGMASAKSRGMENAHRERIWFSPACDRPAAPTDLYNDGGDE